MINYLDIFLFCINKESLFILYSEFPSNCKQIFRTRIKK